MATATKSKTSPKTDLENEAPLTNKATSAAHDAVDALSSKAAAAEGGVRQGAASSAQSLNEKQLAAREKLEECTSKTRQFASENPLATAGIAFAAGMLATSLFRRK